MHSCEVCGKKYNSLIETYDCEINCKQDNCKHETIDYRFYSSYQCRCAFITSLCLDCGKTLRKVRTQSALRSRPDILKKVLEML
jgi:hypothetical protein